MIRVPLLMIIIYLIKGTGNACAGHRTVTLLLTIASNVRDLSIVGNFGLTLPTGSNLEDKVYNNKTWSIKKLRKPNSWVGYHH